MSKKDAQNQSANHQQMMVVGNNHYRIGAIDVIRRRDSIKRRYMWDVDKGEKTVESYEDKRDAMARAQRLDKDDRQFQTESRLGDLIWENDAAMAHADFAKIHRKSQAERKAIRPKGQEPLQDNALIENPDYVTARKMYYEVLCDFKDGELLNNCVSLDPQVKEEAATEFAVLAKDCVLRNRYVELQTFAGKLYDLGGGGKARGKNPAEKKKILHSILIHWERWGKLPTTSEVIKIPLEASRSTVEKVVKEIEKKAAEDWP